MPLFWLPSCHIYQPACAGPSSSIGSEGSLLSFMFHMSIIRFPLQTDSDTCIDELVEIFLKLLVGRACKALLHCKPVGLPTKCSIELLVNANSTSEFNYWDDFSFCLRQFFAGTLRKWRLIFLLRYFL